MVVKQLLITAVLLSTGIAHVARAQCPDAYEPNNSREGAAFISAPSTTNNLGSCGDDDWFGFIVPANHGLRVSVLFSHQQGDLDAWLYDAEGQEIMAAESLTDNEYLAFELSAAESNFYVRVGGYSSSTNVSYSLAVEVFAGGYLPCQDDVYENNDSLSTAEAVSGNTTLEAIACDHHDWYSLLVPANHGGMAELRSDANEEDLILELYSDEGLLLLDERIQNGRAFVELDPYQTEISIFIRVVNRSYGNALARPYTLGIELCDGECSGCFGEDGYEPNDTSEGAASLSLPFQAYDLLSCDEDWYSFTQPAQKGIAVQLLFTHAQADLDLYLVHPDNIQGTLMTSNSETDDESLCYRPGLVAQPLYLLVDNYTRSGSSPATTRYDLHIAVVDSCDIALDAGPGSDAARSDGALSDAIRVDATGADAAQPDTAQPDAAQTDTAQTDTAQTDTAQPDTAQPDSSASDGYQPDSRQDDSSLVDTAVTPDSRSTDTAVPDVVQPDAGTSDRNQPDTRRVDAGGQADATITPDSTSQDSGFPADAADEDSSDAPDRKASSDISHVGEPGCGCVQRTPSGSAFVFVLLGLCTLWARRRSHRE